MPDLPSPSAESLLERCILLLEAGDRAGVDTLLAAHPDFEPSLRERLAQLAALGILQPPREPPPMPERLGEFRLLRQIGRGGMGVVYLAEQTSLQREVALKLVHPEQLFFGSARERFRREVLAVARLSHPGIVPILTCGEAEGIPFYAMDRVVGASLAEVLSQLTGTAHLALDGPSLRAALQRAMSDKGELDAVDDAPCFHGSWTSVCCRLLLDAAVAMQHAHSNGVLHRDVKPSNLLLTAAGRVRVIDFGLASAEGEQRITRSGATMGSLPYMAPEQVRGDTAAIDERTDVYALGVTLYELLTLTLPYGTGDPGTRERILAGRVESPSRRNPTVHPDAEAVCLVAMDPDPARRYASAALLADDLRAFLEQRSVRARRPGPVLRARRWILRNPWRAAAATVAFVALVPGPLVFAWQQNEAAGRIQRALDDTRAEQRRAEFMSQQALEAVDQMLLRTAEARLADVPRTAKLRQRLLQDAVAFHQRLLAAASEASGNRVRADRARAQMRLGALQGELGDFANAVPMLRSAIATFDELLVQAPDDRALMRLLASTHDGLADALVPLGDKEQAAIERRRAMELSERVAQATGAEADIASGVEARLALAVDLGERTDRTEAHGLLEDLGRRLDDPADPVGRLPAAQRQLFRTRMHTNRGIVFANAGDTAKALWHFERAIAESDARIDDVAPHPRLDADRCEAIERLALVAHQRRQWEKAAPWLDRICDEYERLAAADPEVVICSVRLARVLSTRASNRRILGNAAGARADLDRAVDLMTRVVRLAPESSEFASQLAVTIAERAEHRFGAGDVAGALEDHERADQVFEQALALAPGDAQTRGNRAVAMTSHASVLAGTSDYASARAMCDRAIASIETLDSPVAAGNRIDILMQSADYVLRDGDAAEAIRRVDRAAAMAKAFLDAKPDDLPRLFTAAQTAANRGTTYLSCRGSEEAIAIWEESLPVCRALAAATPAGRQVLAIVLLRLADVSLRDEDVPGARRWFEEAVRDAKATAAMVESIPPLPSLFRNPALQDLLPADHPDR